ncbi:hypothetical protein BJ741DRAFT_181995 [Chytriomyces cf. hyalinus JEL632]|nr:hypothetical protein BJ741DRAFT_181995 [Chytriomyces cf. hyalinus JEL632]
MAKTEGDFSLQGVLTAFMVQLLIAFGCIVGFSLLRPANKVVYQPRLKFASDEKKPPPLGATPTAWVAPIMSEDSAKGLSKLGLDAVIFLKFVKYCFVLFCSLTILGIPYIAINANFQRITGDVANTGTAVNTTDPAVRKDIDNSNILGTSLVVLSISQLDVESPWYWMPTGIAWFFSLSVYFMLYRMYYVYRIYRTDYFNSSSFQNSLHQKTLLLTDVPDHLRNEAALSRYMSSQSNAAPSQIIVNRSVPTLAKLVAEHEKITKKFEAVLNKYLADPANLPAKRPTINLGNDPVKGLTGSVDAIQFLGDRLNELEEKIYQIRAQPDADHPANSAGFASYENVIKAHEVAQHWGAASRKFTKSDAMLKPISAKLSPKFDDIIWDNIGMAPAERATRRLVALGLTAGISVGWVIVAGLITPLSNLTTVFSNNPSVVAWLAANPRVTSFLQTFLVPVLLAILNFLLPIVLKIVTRMQGAKSNAGVERSVLYKLFTFNMVQIFLFTAGSALLTAYRQPRIEGVSITDDFKFKITGAITGLAGNSNFYISVLASYYAGYGIEIIQGLPLVGSFIRRRFYKLTPRDQFALNQPPSFDFTRVYGTLLIAFTIALTFSVVAPIILPFSALFFGLAFVVMKYQLLYVYEIKNESHGTYFLKIFNILAFSIGFFQLLTLTVIFAANRASASVRVNNVKQWMVLAPLPFVTAALWLVFRMWLFPTAIYCTATLGSQSIPPRQKLEGEAATLEDRVFNPALVKPLMKVWVSHKSAHLLPSLYKPRYANIDEYEAQHPEHSQAAKKQNRRQWVKGLPSLAGKKKEIAQIKAVRKAGTLKRTAGTKQDGWDDDEVRGGGVGGRAGGESYALHTYGDNRATSALSVESNSALILNNRVGAVGPSDLDSSSEDLLPPEEMEALRILEQEERRGQASGPSAPPQSSSSGQGGRYQTFGTSGAPTRAVPGQYTQEPQQSYDQRQNEYQGSQYATNDDNGRHARAPQDYGRQQSPPRKQSLPRSPVRGQSVQERTETTPVAPPRRTRTDRK